VCELQYTWSGAGVKRLCYLPTCGLLYPCRFVSVLAIRIRRVLTTMTPQQSEDRPSKPAMIAFPTEIGLWLFPEWVRIGCRH